MIWLTMRQFRAQALTVFAAVIVVAIMLGITGPGLLDQSRTAGANFVRGLDSSAVNKGLYLFGLVLYVVPGIIGAFWGAPLIARELEANTHRLVWNQSIPRKHWLAVKLTVTGLAAVLASGLLSLAISWWADPIDDAIGTGDKWGVFNATRLDPAVFGARGIVPVAYVLFAFVLGVAVGLVIRRSVPAMAVTLAAVVVVQVAMPTLVREHLAEPVTQTFTITSDNMRGLMISGDDPEHPSEVKELHVGDKSGAWMLSNATIDSAGKVASTLPLWVMDCGGGPNPNPKVQEPCFERLATEGYQQQLIYHPASHFWTLQWRESGLLVVLAALLTGFCFWRIRRDFS